MARRLLFIALALALAVVAVAAWSRGPAPAPAPSATPTLAPPTVTAVRPSPTAAPTTAASPSPSPSGPAGTAPPAACPAQGGGDPNAQAQLTAIRTAHQPGSDRVVFEFGPSPIGTYGLPAYEISAVTQFVGGGSGRPVPVDGNAFLQVRFRNASTVDPSTGRQTFTQSDIRPGLSLLREVKLIDDFERVMTWGLGLERLTCARVTELAGPARLVVDLPTPP